MSNYPPGMSRLPHDDPLHDQRQAERDELISEAAGEWFSACVTGPNSPDPQQEYEEEWGEERHTKLDTILTALRAELASLLAAPGRVVATDWDSDLKDFWIRVENLCEPQGEPDYDAVGFQERHERAWEEKRRLR